MSRAFFALCLLLLGPLAGAQEIRPFQSGSLEGIVASRPARPFVLAFWSLDCGHCREELALFGSALRRHPGFDLVLVSTDSEEAIPLLSRTLAEFGLGRAEAWVFADPVPERLRFEIDRKWRGELPRSYFYDGRGGRSGVSGRIDAARLDKEMGWTD